ncbi:hypothetical protein Droror1_Dr00002420 [Drosera rotundifolia]
MFIVIVHRLQNSQIWPVSPPPAIFELPSTVRRHASFSTLIGSCGAFLRRARTGRPHTSWEAGHAKAGLRINDAGHRPHSSPWAVRHQSPFPPLPPSWAEQYLGRAQGARGGVRQTTKGLVLGCLGYRSLYVNKLKTPHRSFSNKTSVSSNFSNDPRWWHQLREVTGQGTRGGGLGCKGFLGFLEL